MKNVQAFGIPYIGHEKIRPEFGIPKGKERIYLSCAAKWATGTSLCPFTWLRSVGEGGPQKLRPAFSEFKDYFRVQTHPMLGMHHFI